MPARPLLRIGAMPRRSPAELAARNPRSLRGREGELARLAQAFGAHERVVVVLGPPGVGKSRLAREAAREVREAGRPVYQARVVGATRDEIVPSLARACGFRFLDDLASCLDAVAACLEEEGSLFVLDGAEACPEVVREVLGDLVDVARGTVLVTSRVALDVPGELVVRVGPLAERDAVALFHDEVARRGAAGIDAAAARALVSRLDGLPLAIELAAMRAVKVGVGSIALGAVEESLPRDALGRLLEASWRGLSPDDRRALGVLACFRGGFDARAASAVLGAGAGDRLAALVGASLVVHDAATGRFDLLAIVRVDAERRARAAGEWDESARRHAEHFVGLTEARADESGAWELLARERDNLLAAFDAMVDGDEAHRVRAARLAARLDPRLVTSGPAPLHRRVLERARAAVAMVDAPLERADVAMALGRFHALRGRHRAALALFEAAGADSRGDVGREGWARAFAAFSLRPLGRLVDAARAGHEALALAAHADDARLACMAGQSLGLVDLDAGDTQASLARFERARAVARVAGAPRLEAIALANEGAARLRLGDPSGAAEASTEARAAFARVGDTLHLVRVTSLDGRVALARGDVGAAEELLGGAVAAARELGDRDGEIEAREGLVHVALARGDRRRARAALEEAEEVARLVDDVASRSRVAALSASVRDESRSVLVITRDGRACSFDGRPVELARRGALRRVLVALAAHRASGAARALDVSAMLAAGWPGERMRPESGAARVYMTVRRLRALGLGPALRTGDDGYYLDPAVDVRWDRDC